MDLATNTATIAITSETTQPLTCGLSDETYTVTFTPGKTKTVSFTL